MISHYRLRSSVPRFLPSLPFWKARVLWVFNTIFGIHSSDDAELLGKVWAWEQEGWLLPEFLNSKVYSEYVDKFERMSIIEPKSIGMMVYYVTLTLPPGLTSTVKVIEYEYPEGTSADPFVALVPQAVGRAVNEYDVCYYLFLISSTILTLLAYETNSCA